MTPDQLQLLLNKQFTIPVEIRNDTFANNRPYRQINRLGQTGFTFTGKELLHAIGSKTAALPANNMDDCINSAYLYANILDFDGANFGYKPNLDMDSDLQTNRSNEIGIGIGCLLANKQFNIDWDTLESIKGLGKRFDYRGKKRNRKHAYEFKGTKYRQKQNSQIESGVEKKLEMHARAENYDVELIISTFLGSSDQEPRIILADPPFDGYSGEYNRVSEIVYSFRHLSRLAQFMGNTPLGRTLYLQARKMQEEKNLTKTQLFGNRVIINEADRINTLFENGKLINIHLDGENYIGRWVDSWLPESKNLTKSNEKKSRLNLSKNLEIFQGINLKLYQHMTENQRKDSKTALRFDKNNDKFLNSQYFSTFTDGTIMGYRLKT